MKNYTYLRFPEFKRKAVTLSYDDGVIFDEKLIDIFNRYGLKATFNINSGLFYPAGGKTRLTESQAVALYKDSGHEIAVHGAKHLSLTEVPIETACKDVLEDRIALEKLFGRIVRGMAYAYGVYSDKVVAMLENCGIKYARTIVATERFDIPEDWLRMPVTCHHNNPRLMFLVDEFLDCPEKNFFLENTPRLFFLWGHSYEFNDDNNWDVIERFAKKIGGRDDIWYATNGEIYDYVQAYDRLEYSVENNMVNNSSAKDVYLNFYGKDIKVPAGKEILIKND
mgnify:CR=1 FL=1